MVPQWRSMGDGLRLETARDVARMHRLPLEVVLKGWYVDAVDGEHGVAAALDAVVIHTDAGRDVVKMANYDALKQACEDARAVAEQEQEVRRRRRLTVVITPYADLDSCVALERLTATEPQFAGYASIDIANRDTLEWKKRSRAALEGEADICRRAKREIEELGKSLYPAHKHRRLTRGSTRDREISMERLVKAHLDAKEYGYAHDVMLLLPPPLDDDKRRSKKKKHDDVLLSPGCYDPCHAGDGVPSTAAQRQTTVDRLKAYKTELSRKFGPAQLHPYPERSILLRMEAQSELQTELANARRQVLDVLESLAEDVESIAQQMESVMNQPSLLGCGV